ncbi:MAG TPA: SRPBCC family protein [Candidatus Binataceae bacterium]|nr:SRPBCC family protein [Candidatus Binataceae bacterium]
MRIRSTLAFLIGLLTSILVVSIVFAATSADMKDFNSTVDKDKNMHLEATAEINAPQDKVFDAISHPELTSKSDPQVQKVVVVSQDSTGKVVEFFGGQQLPIPNAPKSLKIKVTPDQASNTIKVESYQSTILKFQNEYKLSPNADGKGTIVKYSSVSNDISKQIGMDIPADMRKQIGLETFMNQLHTVGVYIDDSAVASAKHK